MRLKDAICHVTALTGVSGFEAQCPSRSVAQRRASRAMRMCCFFLPCVEKSVLFVGDGSLALIIYVALLYAVHVGNSVARGFAAA